jgi:hypothetical protein
VADTEAGEIIVMADDNTNNAHDQNQPPQPNPDLKSLDIMDIMVGTWDLKGRESGPYGEIRGRPTFE